MGRKTEYFQPFLERIPLDTHPEITTLIKDVFEGHTPALRNNLYTIISQFLRVPVVAVSRDPRWYKEKVSPVWFNYLDAVRAQDLLIQRGFVTMEIGRRAKPGFSTGFSSRLSSTRQLDDMIRSVELKAPTADISEIAPLTLDRYPGS